MPTTIIPQHLFLDANITGTASTRLDRRTLKSAKLTNTITTGAAQGELVYNISKADARKWPYGLRAMDYLQIQAQASSSPNDTTRVPIWTGFLDAVELQEDPSGGLTATLQASTVWKALEVQTETAAQYDQQSMWQGLPAADIVAKCAAYCGVPLDAAAPGTADPVTDFYSLVEMEGASALVNPQYQNWAAIAASASAIVGMELFANEVGHLQFRQSQYDTGAVGKIPAQRILGANVNLDTDQGIVNQVQVRWGIQGALVFQQAVAGPPDGYDVGHYRPRVLIIPAPWINGDGNNTGQAQAQWYADWALSWAMHNSRIATVSLAFWPQARIGVVYQLDWQGSHWLFYCASVVHDITVGGQAVTTLGLMYGRPLNVTWFQEPAPANFGQLPLAQPTPTPPSPGAPAKSPNSLPTGTNWQITDYTMQDPGQAPLNQFVDSGGVYAVTSGGAKLYQDGWMPPQATEKQSYGKMRPCGFYPKTLTSPGYQVPELGNVTLSYGDVVRLQNGLVLQCWDTGGAGFGRHFDVFYWSQSLVPDGQLPSPQSVTFLNVANLSLQRLPNQTPFGPSPSTPLVPVGRGDMTKAAAFGAQLAPQIPLNGNGYNNVLVPGTAWTLFAQSAGYTDEECTIFVIYLITQIGGAAGIVLPGGNYNWWPNAYGFATYLAGVGWNNVTGQVPQVGDVLVFAAGSTPSTSDGHVGIISAVNQPDAFGNGGYVTLASANCYYPIASFTLYQGPQGYTIGGLTSGASFGESVIAWMRYGL